MREHKLTTIEEAELLAEAADYAKEVDRFLVVREQSVLSKLIAIGGATEGESFEVQVKVRIDDPELVEKALIKTGINIIYHRHYREYDTYFLFDDPAQGQLRYREDEFIDAKGNVQDIRNRLTLVGEPHEREFPSDVMLSRSRFLAPADQSLRFYREYFKPSREISIQKDRLRWLVGFRDTEFYVNIDRIDEPDLGYYLEIKSRTWSRKDAELKSRLALELMKFLGVSSEETEAREYVRLIEDQG